MQTAIFINMLQPLVSKALVKSLNFSAPFMLVFNLSSCGFQQREVSFKKVFFLEFQEFGEFLLDCS